MADHWRHIREELSTDAWHGPAVAFLFSLAVVGLAMWWGWK